MPPKLKRKRDFVRETTNYYGRGPAAGVTKLQRLHRKQKASSAKARRMLLAEGVNLKNKDVHHIDGNPLNNKRSNLKAVPISKNRSNNQI